MSSAAAGGAGDVAVAAVPAAAAGGAAELSMTTHFGSRLAFLATIFPDIDNRLRLIAAGDERKDGNEAAAVSDESTLKRPFDYYGTRSAGVIVGEQAILLHNVVDAKPEKAISLSKEFLTNSNVGGVGRAVATVEAWDSATLRALLEIDIAGAQAALDASASRAAGAAGAAGAAAAPADGEIPPETVEAAATLQNAAAEYEYDAERPFNPRVDANFGIPDNKDVERYIPRTLDVDRNVKRFRWITAGPVYDPGPTGLKPQIDVMFPDIPDIPGGSYTISSDVWRLIGFPTMGDTVVSIEERFPSNAVKSIRLFPKDSEMCAHDPHIQAYGTVGTKYVKSVKGFETTTPSIPPFRVVAGDGFPPIIDPFGGNPKKNGKIRFLGDVSGATPEINRLILNKEAFGDLFIILSGIEAAIKKGIPLSEVFISTSDADLAGRARAFGIGVVFESVKKKEMVQACVDTWVGGDASRAQKGAQLKAIVELFDEKKGDKLPFKSTYYPGVGASRTVGDLQKQMRDDRIVHRILEILKVRKHNKKVLEDICLFAGDRKVRTEARATAAAAAAGAAAAGAVQTVRQMAAALEARGADHRELITARIARIPQGAAAAGAAAAALPPCDFTFAGTTLSFNLPELLIAADGTRPLLSRITQHLLANVQRLSDAEFDKRVTQCTFKPFLYASTDWRNGATTLKISRFDKLITPTCLDTVKARVPSELDIVPEERENVLFEPPSAAAPPAAPAAVAEITEEDIKKLLASKTVSLADEDISVVLAKSMEPSADLTDPVSAFFEANSLQSIFNRAVPRRGRDGSRKSRRTSRRLSRRRVQRGGLKENNTMGDLVSDILSEDPVRIKRANDTFNRLDPYFKDTYIFHAVSDIMCDTPEDADDFRNYAFEFLKKAGANADPCTMCYLFDQWYAYKYGVVPAPFGGAGGPASLSTLEAHDVSALLSPSSTLRATDANGPVLGEELEEELVGTPGPLVLFESSSSSPSSSPRKGAVSSSSSASSGSSPRTMTSGSSSTRPSPRHRIAPRSVDDFDAALNEFIRVLNVYETLAESDALKEATGEEAAVAKLHITPPRNPGASVPVGPSPAQGETPVAQMSAAAAVGGAGGGESTRPTKRPRSESLGSEQNVSSSSVPPLSFTEPPPLKRRVEPGKNGNGNGENNNNRTTPRKRKSSRRTRKNTH